METFIIYNNNVKDAFFVKALMINNEKGNAVIGASYRFRITDLDDEKFTVIGS